MSSPARCRIPLAFCIGVVITLLALLGAGPAAAAPTADDCAMRAMKPAALVEAKRDAGATFPSAELLAPDRGLATKALGVPDEVAREGALNRPDFRAIANFLKRAPETFTLPVDGPSGVTELELVRVDIATPDFKVVTSASNGQAVPYEPGVHYRGKVKGDPDSYAAVSVFKDEVMGSYFSAADDTVVIGRLRGDNPNGEHIVYATRAIDEHNQFTCGNNGEPEKEPVDRPLDASSPFDFSDFSTLPTPNPAAAAEAKSLAAKAGNKCVRIYVETGYDMFQSLGGVSAVANYVTGFFNQSAVLYSHESIPIGLSEIFVWYGPDPYAGDDTTTILGNFVNYRRSYNGDFGHLVAFHGGGGLANNIGAFCNADPGERTCFSGVDPSYANVPTYSWTVNVFTHEMGHLMGSRHTHACVWNGNDTQIDGCADPEGSCPRIGLPAAGGTIMSYCHLQSVGIRFNNGFGTQPGNVIRSRYNAAGCLGPCGATVGPKTCPAPTQCGTISCPTGCYPASTNACGSGLTGNQTTCREVTGPRLSTCEDHCPAGYYVQAARSNVPSCERGYGGIQMDCAQVAGNSLTTCQTQCPDGYYPSFVSQNPVTCAVAFGGWQTRCDKVSGNTVTTCDDDCPTGFYPFSTTGNSVSCGGPYAGIQTQCKQTAGTTLNVCGSSCPTGYFLQRTNTGIGSCQARYGGVQSVCTNSPAQQCDEGCPDGFYVSKTVPDTGCINHVRTFCEPVVGNSLRTCQDVCPPEFYASESKSNVADCALIWGGIQIQCQRVLGDLLRTCEDNCPDNYYPSAAATNQPVCAVRYGGVQTDCSKITGDSLTTCGQTCPVNFLPVLTSPNTRCSTVYQNVQTLCSKVPPVGEPRITQQPQSVTIVAGQSATLSVTATGQSPISFQWYRGAGGDRTNPISGATNQSVIVHPTVTTSYWVLVKNNKGEVASDTATVTVTPSCIPPAITTQPQPVSIAAGGTATLSVTATGTDLLYQWYVGVFLGWSPISGANASSVAVTPAASSNYKVTVHNSCGTVDSSTTLVTVTQPCTAPAITTQP
ncbi:MAG TPA: M12 family metallo-peptidase, partial [Thermoanaerobaculia bacterium]|nr:M12 family metallo-peptidase [Thermoanaerobaculia bacterium]